MQAAASTVTNNVEVVPVETRRAAREFLEFPYRHYRHDGHWVAPLRIDQKKMFNTDAHPFWKHAEMGRFLAFSHGRVCGRIAAIADQYSCGIGTFGFFESIDDEAVATALFRAASEWLAGRGIRRARGPMNPSINYECGLLVDGFDSPPRIMMTYNPPYYPELFRAAGLRKEHDLYAYEISDANTDNGLAKVDRASRLYSIPGAKIRPVRMDRYEEELEAVWRIYNSAWSENWGAVKASREEIRFLGLDLKPILIPDLTLVCEVAGEPVAFGLVIPDANEAIAHAKGSLFPLGLPKILYYKSRIKKLRVLALGVLKPYRETAIAAELYAALARNALRLGYREAECSWISEDNRSMNRTLDFLGARRSKTYRIYELPLDA